METDLQDIRLESEDCEFVHDLLQQRLSDGQFEVPVLPEVAVRVVQSRDTANARQLSDIIETDAALTLCVLRIVASAATRPATPIASLQHAVAWLGLDEVANIAFTLALQGTMLDVPGHRFKARRLWRHSLASALWSRQLAARLRCEAGLCYLCGLLHDIGRAVTFRAAHEIARKSGRELSGDDNQRLVEIFHRTVAQGVVSAWRLPAPIFTAATLWQTYQSAGAASVECNIVNLAHQLADFTLLEPLHLTRDELIATDAYRDLGWLPEDAAALFDAAQGINAELDRYLAR